MNEQWEQLRQAAAEGYVPVVSIMNMAGDVQVSCWKGDHRRGGIVSLMSAEVEFLLPSPQREYFLTSWKMVQKGFSGMKHSVMQALEV